METRSAYPAVSSLPRLLSSRRRLLAFSRGWLPNQSRGYLRPLPQTGKPSCDGSTAEFRIVDLISHHDVSADEKFSGGCHFGFWPAAALRQTLIETL